MPSFVLSHDKGAQYSAVRPAPRRRRGAPSTGSTGDSFDNALAENLWSTIKVELLYWPGTTFATRAEAEHALIRQIDGWYNPRRIQAGLGGLSPDEFEESASVAELGALAVPAALATFIVAGGWNVAEVPPLCRSPGYL